MLRVASAEVRYGAATLAAWSLVLLLASLWPLLEAPTAAAVPAVLAFLALMLPVGTTIITFSLLNVERGERRLRLFGVLPTSAVALGVARHVRTWAMPALALLLALLLLAVGVVAEGWQFLSHLSGAWVLPFLLLASVGVSALVTLLYDIGGMAFAQITGAILVLAAFALNAYAEEFSARLVEPVTALAQTPLGVLAAALVCALLVAADVALFVRGRGRRA